MKRIILLLVLCFSFNAQQAMADNRHRLSHKKQTFTVNNPQQAARLVRSRFRGRVLKIRKKNNHGRPAYQVKILTKKGHVIYVLVDAKSGQIQG